MQRKITVGWIVFLGLNSLCFLDRGCGEWESVPDEHRRSDTSETDPAHGDKKVTQIANKKECKKISAKSRISFLFHFGLQREKICPFSLPFLVATEVGPEQDIVFPSNLGQISNCNSFSVKCWNPVANQDGMGFCGGSGD